MNNFSFLLLDAHAAIHSQVSIVNTTQLVTFSLVSMEQHVKQPYNCPTSPAIVRSVLRALDVKLPAIHAHRIHATMEYVTI